MNTEDERSQRMRSRGRVIVITKTQGLHKVLQLLQFLREGQQALGGGSSSIELCWIWFMRSDGPRKQRM